MVNHLPDLLKDDLDFNTLVVVNVFYLNGKPVLYIVDKGTSYQAGRFL